MPGTGYQRWRHHTYGGALRSVYRATACNQVSAHDIALNLRIFRHRWPFLGYIACRAGRLYLDGDAGDFAGALLDGGEVVVTGNAWQYTSIGMKTGTVQIAGQYRQVYG